MKTAILLITIGTIIIIPGILRPLQLATIKVIKRNTKTYADVKAERRAHNKLDPWEQQFNHMD